ncbi:hypothetical protein SOX05_08635 [Pseudomonas putida]|nr:hypothetical protein [Pseudomonas putida]MDY4319327.1 hypothetical protein [Pseudomonas putida]MDY4352712.1 hypothetical protein [Pseudomonas putida]
MREINQQQAVEIKIFEQMADAVISADTVQLLDSGFLDRSDYEIDGELYRDVDDYVSQDLANTLISSSSGILTAFQVDKRNNEVGGEFSQAELQNMDKAYIIVDIADGDYVDCKIILSNDLTYQIAFLDKEGDVLTMSDPECIEKFSELHNLGNHISSEYDFTDQLISRSGDECMYYLKNIDDAYFDSQESIDDFKIRLVSEAVGKVPAEDLVELFINNEAPISHLIFKDNSLLAEAGGVIFCMDRDNYTIEVIEEGNQFTFKGITAKAEPRVLHNIEWELTKSGHSIDSVHREAEVEPEPEVKKTRTMKPGR